MRYIEAEDPAYIAKLFEWDYTERSYRTQTI